MWPHPLLGYTVRGAGNSLPHPTLRQQHTVPDFTALYYKCQAESDQLNQAEQDQAGQSIHDFLRAAAGFVSEPGPEAEAAAAALTTTPA